MIIMYNLTMYSINNMRHITLIYKLLKSTIDAKKLKCLICIINIKV